MLISSINFVIYLKQHKEMLMSLLILVNLTVKLRDE